jgi:tRNA pseudouridine55 synthase
MVCTNQVVAERRASRERRAIDGVLLLDKPRGMSSNGALQAAKRLLQARKAGHAGTLDPLATGLLPLLFGEATKLAFLLSEADKSYVADLRLGTTTTTGDAEGEVIDVRPVRVSAAEIEHALRHFRGPIDQVPPMYSALKHGGRPLYDYARAGERVERPARRVHIHRLELLERSANGLRIRVDCSKGTYIRTLAEDIGALLGTGACLDALRRTASGAWNIAQALSLEQLGSVTEAAARARLLPSEAALAGLARITLDEVDAVRFAQGQARPGGTRPPGLYGVFGPMRCLLGVGEIGSDGWLRPRRVLTATEPAQPAEKHRETL